MDNAIEPLAQVEGGIMAVVLKLAANPEVDIEKLQRMLEMQERWEVNRDKAALRHAMAEFKRNPPEIVKRRIGEMRGQAKASGRDYAFEYRYADLDDVIGAVEQELGKAGITLAWPQTDTPNLITVTCVLRYGLYEGDGCTMSAPPDDGGAKSPIQARASTVSYLRRVTALGALGMAAGMPDNDGKAAAAPDVSALAKAETLESLADIYREMYNKADAAKDKAALKAIIEAKDKRYAELAEIAQRQYAEAAQEIATLDQFNERIVPLMKERGGEFKLWWAGEAKRRGWKANKASGLYEEAK